MAEPPPVYRDDRRAGSFGSAADEYDRYRPRYPDSLVRDLVTQDGIRALDVGAGTGIASVQLMDAGATVLAVEPNARMAEKAMGKNVAVEQATFEEWDPAGRSFALVVFAQSFHWVEPWSALAKVANVLEPDGRLVLLSNHITPVQPARPDLDHAYAGLLNVSERPAVDAARDKALGVVFAQAGFSVEKRRVVEHLHYAMEEWVQMVCTYSSVLTLEPQARDLLRRRLIQLIGSTGVDAVNEAVAVICTRVTP